MIVKHVCSFFDKVSIQQVHAHGTTLGLNCMSKRELLNCLRFELPELSTKNAPVNYSE